LASPVSATGRTWPKLRSSDRAALDLRRVAELLEKQAKRYPNARASARLRICSKTPSSTPLIATPVPTHAPLAKQALEAGKHVFVEKPMAMNGADAEEIVALPKERAWC